MKLFGNMLINQHGHLEINGVDTTELVKEYSTPLYVMDESYIRTNCKLFYDNFVSEDMKTEVIYASKAFLTVAMCRLIDEEGLSLDVVSGGELYTALQAKFPVERIYFHGNNKSEHEIRMAIEAGIGRIIIDNRYELKLIEKIAKELNKKVAVLLRVNPGISAHTHDYISTTKNDSKFGESIFHEEIYDIIQNMGSSPYMNFKGFHSHIGSQIFEEESYFNQINVMMAFVKNVTVRLKVDVEEVNLGGGFGVYYVEGDLPIELQGFFIRLFNHIKTTCDGLTIKIPKILIEPGRSIVANAGVTLYTVGSTKTTFGGKSYVFVDGGMADNIRTALYDAKYEAALANRMNDPIEGNYTVSGKCCESGDMLVKDVLLPTPQIGDVLVVSSTGAYNYSMSSNYNRLARPAVVFIKDGDSRVVVKRETYTDLIRNDVI